jgi:hypoxanthine phosphoribosyltransferase
MDWISIISVAFGVLGAIVSIYQAKIWVAEWRDRKIDSFSSIERHGVQLLHKISTSGFRPDFVLGLGRSGAFLGGWIAGNLGSIPIEVIDRIHKNDVDDPMDFPYVVEKFELLRRAYGDRAKVLVVEGATVRGATSRTFFKYKHHYASDWNCRFCVLYRVETSDFPVDFVAKMLKAAPRRFPWHRTGDYQDFIRPSRNFIGP